MKPHELVTTSLLAFAETFITYTWTYWRIILLYCPLSLPTSNYVLLYNYVLFTMESYVYRFERCTSHSMLMAITTCQTASIFVNNHLESCTTLFSLKTTSITRNLNHNFNYTVLTHAWPLNGTLLSNAPFTPGRNWNPFV